MRAFGLVIAFVVVCASLTMSCVPPTTGANSSVVAADEVDTLGEAIQVFIEWVNKTDVKAEFDMVVDNNPAIHFELPALDSTAILIAPMTEPARNPITVDANNVTVVRVNTTCPNEITFENVFFGDAFFAASVPFAQGAAPDESTLGVDANGVQQPVSFVCYSAWQVIIEESSIVVTALDRQAGGSDEAEIDVSTELTGGSSTTPTTTTTTPTTPTAPRALPDIAPTAIDRVENNEALSSIPAPSL